MITNGEFSMAIFRNEQFSMDNFQWTGCENEQCEIFNELRNVSPLARD